MSQEQRLVETVVFAWNSAIVRLDNLLSSLPDNGLGLEIAPGRNRVLYIVGHLAAHHDRLFALLRLGERLHPELDHPFIVAPDTKEPSPTAFTSTQHVLEAWKLVNHQLAERMASLTAPEWLERHNNVSPEDFLEHPLRNRLAVLISRTNHVAYHTGQIQLVR